MANPFDELNSELKQIREELSNLKNLVENEKEVDKILYVSDVSLMLGVTPITIYRKVKDGSIPHMKRGRKLLFSRNALLDWLKGSSNF